MLVPFSPSQKELTLQDRAHLYNTHPKYGEYAKYAPLVGTDYYLFGWWLIGNDYSNASDFYGAYPHGYLDRMAVIFPEFTGADTLHLFSGSLDDRVEGFRVDSMQEKRHPHLFTDAHHLPFRANSWSIIYADPPYSARDAERYKTKMPTRYKVVRECGRILRPNGFLVWLDVVFPMFRKEVCTLVGHISITRSTNHAERTAFIFQRTENIVQQEIT